MWFCFDDSREIGWPPSWGHRLVLGEGAGLDNSVCRSGKFTELGPSIVPGVILP